MLLCYATAVVRQVGRMSLVNSWQCTHVQNNAGETLQQQKRGCIVEHMHLFPTSYICPAVCMRLLY
jgi:hypothetical protein